MIVLILAAVMLSTVWNLDLGHLIAALGVGSIVLGLALRNRNLMKSIILREGIDCDFSPRGWLYLADSEQEEQGIEQKRAEHTAGSIRQ